MSNPLHCLASLEHDYDLDSPAVPLIEQIFSIETAIELITRAIETDGYFGVEIQQRLEQLGHDGLVATYPDGSYEVVVFSLHRSWMFVDWIAAQLDVSYKEAWSSHSEFRGSGTPAGGRLSAWRVGISACHFGFVPPVKSRNLFPPPAKRNQANGQIHPELLDGYTYMLDGDRTVDTAVQELKEAFSPQAIFDSAERRLIKLNPGTTQDLHAYISVGYNQFGADARAVAFKILVTDTEQTAGNALLCAEGYFIATTCKGLDLVIAMDNISQDVYLAGELFSQGWPRRNGTFTLFTQLIVHPDLRSPVLHDLMLELEGVSAHYRRTSQLSPRGSCWFSTGILSRPTCCWSSAVSAPFTNNGTNSACSASQRNLSSPIDPAHAPLASEFASSGSTLALNRPPPLPAGSHPLGSRRQPLSAYQSDLRSPCPFAIALSISSTRNPTGTRRHSTPGMPN